MQGSGMVEQPLDESIQRAINAHDEVRPPHFHRHPSTATLPSPEFHSHTSTAVTQAHHYSSEMPIVCFCEQRHASLWTPQLQDSSLLPHSSTQHWWLGGGIQLQL